MALFDREREQIRSRMPAALVAALEHIHTVASPITPRETGNLDGSADITAVGDEGQIYYPGPYALYQHEGVFYRHGHFGAPLNYQGGGGPFFLLKPMISEHDKVIEIIANELFRGM